MFKELLKNVWIVKKEFFCIIAILSMAMFACMYAHWEGKKKTIDLKISDWEQRYYALTEFRKGIIREKCLDEDIEVCDSIISFFGFQQKNYGRK